DVAEHNTIEVYIRRLRRIIGRDAIITHRGQGYVFNAK
ncbi:MAG: two-component system OmpR family response regulator, partial [Chitinophagales bacterium]